MQRDMNNRVREGREREREREIRGGRGGKCEDEHNNVDTIIRKDIIRKTIYIFCIVSVFCIELESYNNMFSV